MTDVNDGYSPQCARVRAALARGGAEIDWDGVDRHLSSCPACAAGLSRFTAAVQEQFAASRSLDVLGGAPEPFAGAPIVVFPATDTGRTVPTRSDRRRFGRRLIAVAAAAAVAAALLFGGRALLPGSSHAPGGANPAAADRRPEFVPSLEVLPVHPGRAYYAGQQLQVCLSINQPSRIHLSVLEGHSTFDLYDADSDPGRHCFPEQVTRIRGRATLRVEVFYGAERVAREDFPILPAAPTP